MSQFLLDGMDITGLDLSRMSAGALSEEHLERAFGDSRTVLPAGLVAPSAWREGAPVGGAGPTDTKAAQSSAAAGRDGIGRISASRNAALRVAIAAGFALVCLVAYVVLSAGDTNGCAGSTGPVTLSSGVILTPDRGWHLFQSSDGVMALCRANPTSVLDVTSAPAPSQSIATDLVDDIRVVGSQFRQLQLGSPLLPKLNAPGFDEIAAVPFAGVEQRKRPLKIGGQFYILLDRAASRQVFAFAYSNPPSDFGEASNDVTRMLAAL